eukprot:COSAG01_NODE_41949_length_445_cov_1.144509_1_plen_43_part_01
MRVRQDLSVAVELHTRRTPLDNHSHLGHAADRQLMIAQLPLLP